MELDTKVHIITSIGVCLTIIGGLFFIPNIMVDRFTTPPAIWIKIIVGIAGILLVFASKNKLLLPPAKFLGLILIYFVFRIINGADWTFLLAEVFYFIVLFNGLKLNKNLKLTIGIICTSSAFCVAVFGFMQYIGYIQPYHAVFHVTGPFSNPAGLGCFLAISFPIILTLLHSSNLKIKIPLIAICVFIFMVICLSASRTALLSVLMVLITYYCIKTLRLKFTIIFGCILLVIASLLYIINPASANGRILIWTCCLQIIESNLWFGIGIGNFQKDYMMAQAEFFKTHPASTNVMLAGNVQHPFNEFIGLFVEQGIIGTVLVTCILGYAIKCMFRYSNEDRRVILMILLSFMICSLFSYPFHYPIFHILLITLVAIMMNDAPKIEIGFLGWKSLSVISLLFVFLISNSIKKGVYEIKWKHRYMEVEERDISKQDVMEFSALYQSKYLKSKGSFLYNYAVILYNSGNYKESLCVLESCRHRINDYNVELLCGFTNQALKNYQHAEEAFLTASYMIPGRILPQYELMKLYASTGQTSAAVRMAKKIIEQPVKKASREALFMKQEAIDFMSNNSMRKEGGDG